jgi:TQXA domain-containing protein/LPXTG-motif cell wall-anchored protein
MNNTWMRAGVALAAVGALGVGMAGTANADDPTSPTKGSITVEGGWTVYGGEGSSVDKVGAGRIWLTPEGSQSAVETYCIDIHTKLDTKHVYQEGAWDKSEVKNLPLVQWVLHNGYPTVDGASLLDAAKVDAVNLDEQTLAQVGYTATQAAVWTLTDDFKLADDATNKDDGIDAAVKGVADYLVANATEMPEMPSEIVIDGPELINTAEKSGPFTVTTPGGDAELTIKGGKIVDKDDNELTSVPNGGEFWIVPEEGAENIVVDAVSTVAQPTGSVFLATDQNTDQLSTKSAVKSQKLILGASIEGEVGTTVTFETETDNTLPVTGMSLTNSLILGAGLLLAGAVALVIFKRRRTAATWGDAA